jgi:hypothetical protein
VALETYDELLNFVVQTLGRRSLEDRVADWIWIAETEAQRELDLEEVEKSISGNTSENVDYIELPNDYVGLRFLKIKTEPVREIRVATPSDARASEAMFRMIENPVVGYVSGGRLYFQRPQASVAYDLLYYAGIEHIGPDNPTSWLLRVGADYLAYTALVHSAMYSGDQRLEMWAPMQQRAEDSMRRQAFRTRTGGGALNMRSDWGHP